jgi:FkbM family methyltransferase
VRSYAIAALLSTPLGGTPLINLVTYVQGGFYDYDAMTALTILLEPGQTFIDVGANIGAYSVLAAELVGAEGHVVAVEPSPEQLIFLRQNLRDLPARTAISTLPLADRARVAELVEHGPTIQYLVEAAPDGAAPTSTLDNELARLGGYKGGFAKIDVEGWEPAVIAGAGAWLSTRPTGLLIEANGLNQRSPVSWDDSVHILQAHEYEYTWPDFSRRVLHLFPNPGPAAPSGDYLVLTSEARECLQRTAGLRASAG